MRDARQCAPRKCVCGRKLSEPVYDFPFPKPLELPSGMVLVFSDSKAPVKEKVWHIKCACGLVHVWSYHPKSNGCWKIRSYRPLFDSQEITVIA